MNIEYDVVIRDNVEGYELIVNSFRDVHKAIEMHKRLQNDTKCLLSIIEQEFSCYSGTIDQYYLNNPHKRYDVGLEISYYD